eukprot:scaffold434_cov186-Pinguiococcus_pyrenoidosus.AAC.36
MPSVLRSSLILWLVQSKGSRGEILMEIEWLYTEENDIDNVSGALDAGVFVPAELTPNLDRTRCPPLLSSSRRIAPRLRCGLETSTGF